MASEGGRWRGHGHGRRKGSRSSGGVDRGCLMKQAEQEGGAISLARGGGTLAGPALPRT